MLGWKSSRKSRFVCWALLFLPAAFVQRQKAPGSVAGNVLQWSCWSGKAPESSAAHQRGVGREQGLTGSSSPGRSCSSPVSQPLFCLFLLLFGSCLFSPPLSHRVTATYLCAELNLLTEGASAVSCAGATWTSGCYLLPGLYCQYLKSSTILTKYPK